MRTLITENATTVTTTMTPSINAQTTQACHCCPYGYHIDLDFVKYCEEIASSAGQTNGKRNPRRDRRKHRHSMEVMLGLQDSITSLESNGKSYSLLHDIIIESDTESPIVPRRQQEPDWVSQIENIPSQNGYHTNGYLSVPQHDRELQKHTPEFLEDVCFDFERTLERSKTKKKDGPPPIPPRNLRHVYGSAVVDSVSTNHFLQHTVPLSTQNQADYNKAATKLPGEIKNNEKIIADLHTQFRVS